jgi:glycosyltransferase involved in cell wall biosynthesis
MEETPVVHGNAGEEPIHFVLKPSVVVVIPCFNEEVSVGSMVLSSMSYADRIVVVDDGSSDRTTDIARLAGAEVIRHEVNKGKGEGIKTAFEYARKVRADILILIDGDGQHNPDEIPRLVEPILKQEADMVNGSRFPVKHSHKVPMYRRVGQFTLDEGIFKFLGISPGSDYVILRFNSHNAVHDVGLKGFGDAEKIRLVQELEKYARVFITLDAGVPEAIRDRVVRFPKNSIHDALYYARLLVADSGTLTMEAAVLGTPAIRSNSFVDNDAGVMKEFGGKYGLILNIADPHEAIDIALELIR